MVSDMLHMDFESMATLNQDELITQITTTIIESIQSKRILPGHGHKLLAKVYQYVNQAPSLRRFPFLVENYFALISPVADAAAAVANDVEPISANQNLDGSQLTRVSELAQNTPG